ncbi:MAG: vWA domain-containing protein [Myxococcota bacterium]
MSSDDFSTILSDASSTLTGNLGAVVLAGAAGTALEDIMAADVTLITVLIDASQSIEQGGLTKAVRAGQNELIDALLAAKEVDSILLAQWIFNDQLRVQHSYVPVADAAKLDAKSYHPAGGTALYDAWQSALTANVSYAQKLRDGGTPVRSVVVVITDGEDNSSRVSAAQCAKLSRALLASEQFVLAFVGVGNEVDFRKVARSMGLPDGGILVQASATAHALRQVFEMVSRSAIRASQGLIKPGAQAGFFGP